MMRSSLHKNVFLLNQLESYVNTHEKLNDAVSGETIGWHIAHSCQVINTITNVIVHSDPSKAKPKFSGAYYWIILTNKIPRGKAKAPNIVIPKKTISKEEIIDEIEPGALRIPVLIKKYVKQNARLVAFNVDPKFNNAVDGLMYIRVSDIPESTVKPVMEEFQAALERKVATL